MRSATIEQQPAATNEDENGYTTTACPPTRHSVVRVFL
jgi:hypothetical protein